ncbi:hypothetical protein DUNSADRAFT_446, partial [Dunaliella salina]
RFCANRATISSMRSTPSWSVSRLENAERASSSHASLWLRCKYCQSTCKDKRHLVFSMESTERYCQSTCKDKM